MKLIYYLVTRLFGIYKQDVFGSFFTCISNLLCAAFVDTMHFRNRKVQRQVGWCKVVALS